MDKEKELVYLESLDGSEFEKLCARILERLGYGEVEDVQDVADEGRDLIARSEKETIVVECKHYLKGTVGRPVVQKLHSAVMTEKAARGMLITSGKFSKGAVDKSKEVHPPIELIDLPILIDMADRAGIRIVVGDMPIPISTFCVSPVEAIKEKFLKHVSTRIRSAPNPLNSLFTFRPEKLNLRPAFLIAYDLHEDFSTTVGTIHSIHINNEKILFDGDSGEPVDDCVASFVLQGTLGELPASTIIPCPVERAEYRVDMETLKRQARQYIIEEHTEWVSYYGRKTSRRYTVRCQPGQRSIFIRDMRQVYIPEWLAKAHALKSVYKLSFFENPLELLIIETDIFNCKTCNKEIKKHGLLCNSCGAITHTPSFFGRKHGFSCKVCKKTICCDCAYRVTRWFFFVNVICEACADNLARQKGKPKRKLTLKGG